MPGYSAAQVEEVRFVIRLLPVFFTTILYWTVYAQMGTFFIMQVGCTHASHRAVDLAGHSIRIWQVVEFGSGSCSQMRHVANVAE